MAHIKAQVSLGIDSGIPEDRPVNVWHFDGVADLTTGADILVALTDFYESVRSHFPSYVNSTDGVVKMYKMSDPEPRVPFLVDTLTLTGGGTGNSLPSEVALCLSFQGSRISGQAQAHRRGRIYLGPLNVSSSDAAGRPSAGLISDLSDAGEALLGASNAASDWKWVVWSPTATTLTIVDNGWVDNAFDTQRRRGLAPTSRTVFP